MNEDLFGHRMRAERLRRRIALESIAAQTKISIGLLREFEHDQLSRWPSGIFRRAFVRAYAEAVGLDADDTLREFLQHYPDPLESSQATPKVAHTAACAAVAQLSRPALRPAPAHAPLRLTLADSRRPFSGGCLLARVRSRIAAAAVDAATIVGLALLVRLGLGMFWAPLGVILLCYHVGGILILGNTPGVYLFAPSTPRDIDRGSPTSSADHDLSDLAPSSIFESRVTS